MGEEITRYQFTKEDVREFDRRLREESDLLAVWLSKRRFARTGPNAGFELEACLTDAAFAPAPRNDEFLATLNSPLVVHELSKFNIEFNGAPREFTASALRDFHDDLAATWAGAQKVAAAMGLRVLMIGILPTLEPRHLVEANMSAAKRYKALNEQILKLRQGKPIEVRIRQNDGLESVHTDVMLEAATTSFQIHLKVPPETSHRYYNVSKMISAPMVGISANSPYLFGRNLWAETRIPLFERGVSVGKWDYSERVTFGVRYFERSLLGVFKANRQRYPVIMPLLFDAPPERMAHTRLHNGTIWRWTRPIIGFEEDGTPHLRIEHRVVPAGPTIADEVAHMAFFYGLMHMVVKEMPELAWDMPFADARDNFYQAARLSLEADVVWKGKPFNLKTLIVNELLPLAEEGLAELGIAAADSKTYLGILRARAESGQTGAEWQRRFVAANGKDMRALSAAYFEHQESGRPVHEWPV
jgi:Glutamate-cysteine ligase family 2(GCS2)